VIPNDTITSKPEQTDLIAETPYFCYYPGHMNICLVGSMRDYDRILDIERSLKEQGNTVIIPIDRSDVRDLGHAQEKSVFMKGMFDRIKTCEAILAVNDRDRGGYKGYIGANTFLQLGIGMSLGKPLFTLEKWDPRLPYSEELNAMGIQQLDIKLPH